MVLDRIAQIALIFFGALVLVLLVLGLAVSCRETGAGPIGSATVVLDSATADPFATATTNAGAATATTDPFAPTADPFATATTDAGAATATTDPFAPTADPFATATTDAGAATATADPFAPTADPGATVDPLATPTLAPAATVTIDPAAPIATATADPAATVAPGATSTPEAATASATATPAATPTTVAPPPSGMVPGATARHAVSRGEWVLQIARCYGVSYGSVLNANYLANPDYILPGWILTIPDIGRQGRIVGPPCVVDYTVAAGDTWDSLAARYQTTTAILMKANPGALVAGRSIWVPRVP